MARKAKPLSDMGIKPAQGANTLTMKYGVSNPP